MVSDGTCEFCRAGLQTSCLHGGFWNDADLGTGGGQAEAVRVPFADGTLVAVPGVDAGTDEDRLAGLLTLSDVYGTGWHAAVRGGVGRGSTVTVIGEGAVGLLAVLSAQQLGAEGIGRVRDLTGGGSEIVPEAVDHRPAYEQAVGIETLLPAVLDGSVRPGRVFDQTVALEDAPKGYAAMDERTALKVVVRP